MVLAGLVVNNVMWINWNIVSYVYIFTKGNKSINAEKNENVELTHTRVFCGRLCVLCESYQYGGRSRF